MQLQRETDTTTAMITVACDDEVDDSDEHAHVEGMLRGSVRHLNCLRIQSDASASFHHGMCAYCASIPKLQDFRQRVIRQTGHAAQSSHKNFRYAPHSHSVC